MFDTHTHLCHSRFRNDREKVFERARKEGIDIMLEVSWDIKSSEEAIRFAEDHEGVWVAVGYHPHDAKDAPPGYLLQIEELCKHPKVKAIGEIGLDFYRDLSPRNIQTKTFNEQIELAESVKLPIVIHSRNAMDETIEIVEQKSHYWGVFHSVSADSNQADRILDLGFYIGINGTLTYDAVRTKRWLINAPRERLLLETDCPYLTPEPHRHERNEPSYLKYVAEALSAVLGESVDSIKDISSKNGKELFLA